MFLSIRVTILSCTFNRRYSFRNLVSVVLLCLKCYISLYNHRVLAQCTHAYYYCLFAVRISYLKWRRFQTKQWRVNGDFFFAYHKNLKTETRRTVFTICGKDDITCMWLSSYTIRYIRWLERTFYVIWCKRYDWLLYSEIRISTRHFFHLRLIL